MWRHNTYEDRHNGAVHENGPFGAQTLKPQTVPNYKTTSDLIQTMQT